MAQPQVETIQKAASATVDDDLAHLRALLEQGDVEGARSFIKEIQSRWPESKAVQHYARVLAPPVVRVVPGASARSLDREHAWLKAHAHEYPGCWIAVLGDRMLAANPDFSAVQSVVRQTPGAKGALFHYQFAQASVSDTELPR